MDIDFRLLLLAAAPFVMVIICVRLVDQRKGRAARSRPINVRPALFAEIGIVLLLVGVGSLTAIAAGVIPSAIALSAIIVVSLGAAVVCFVYSVLFALLYDQPSGGQKRTG
jgi:hypothetical protein